MAAAPGPRIVGSLPGAGLFGFPPTGAPAPLAPAPTPLSLLRPFNIPGPVFGAALDARVPLTVAVLYAAAAKALNRHNRSNRGRPWAMSKTRPFAVLVVVHNIALALYSLWTFCGMLGGMRRSIVHPGGPGGLAATADSFCHIHGPPGLGASIYFNDSSAAWETADPAVVVAGPPSSSQMGRLWNECLAYYGWIFYLSKFYEVLDTFIILAKGKLSSTLQTYHHAGAMLCMWAGMRYMSAPIWMFVLVNSFIHSLMYTYYTLTAFSIKVPVIIKRTLTTMQITQFLVGASFAMAHSFVTYMVPITVTRPAPALVGLPPAPVDMAVPTPGVVGSFKKLLFASAVHDAAGPVQEQTTIAETTYLAQPCTGTTGETFAIWLNVLYLAPLTYLFVSFFIASYLKRSNAAHKVVDNAKRLETSVALAEKAGWDAARGVEREVYGGENMVDGAVASAVLEGKHTSKKANSKTKPRA